MKKPPEGGLSQRRASAYLAALTRYSTACLKSASDAVEPPLGGIAPLPCVAIFSTSSKPAARRGAQAALSPNLGAPATPVPWQATQVES